MFYQQSIRFTITWYHLNFKVWQSVVKCCLFGFLFVLTYSWFLMTGAYFYMFNGQWFSLECLFVSLCIFVFTCLFISSCIVLGLSFVVIVDFFSIPYIFYTLIFISYMCCRHMASYVLSVAILQPRKIQVFKITH